MDLLRCPMLKRRPVSRGAFLGVCMENTEWTNLRNQLVQTVTDLGYPQELGLQIVKNLGSPKAMSRMIAYLKSGEADSVEDIVDEMLSLKEEIQNWKAKKARERANAVYNEVLYYGLEDDDLK